MSGAGRIKFDGSDDDYLIEVKDAKTSHTVRGSLVASLWLQATRQGKQPLMIINFGGGYRLRCLIERNVSGQEA